MSLKHRVGLSVLIFLFCTGFDRLTKDYAQRNLATAAPLSLINDALRIQYAENPGVMLGIGATLPGVVRFALFVVMVSAAIAALLAYAVGTRGLNRLQLIGLLFVGSGGIGNLIDRLTNNGAGIDFLNMGIGPLRTGIFNVADVFIVAGLVMAFLGSTRDPIKRTQI